MAREFENFYGDTAALNVPGRWYAFDTILSDPLLRSRLVHGSDWPIPRCRRQIASAGEASWKIWERAKLAATRCVDQAEAGIGRGLLASRRDAVEDRLEEGGRAGFVGRGAPVIIPGYYERELERGNRHGRFVGLQLLRCRLRHCSWN